MIRPLWKVIGLILSVGLFLVVAVVNLTEGEELVWVVTKAIIAFFVSWIVLNNLGSVLLSILDKHEDTPAPGENSPSAERGS